MPAWYDLFGLTPDSKEDVDGIEESAKILHSMIDAVSAFIVHFHFILWHKIFFHMLCSKIQEYV